MRHRVILRLRRESGMVGGTAAAIWLLLQTRAPTGDRIATGFAAAALLAPMLIAALYYGTEARRLVRGGRPHAAARPMLRLGQAVCVALLITAAADLVWRWDRLGPTVAAASALVTAAAALTYAGYFHRRVAPAGAGRFRLARTSMRRALTARASPS